MRIQRRDFVKALATLPVAVKSMFSGQLARAATPAPTPAPAQSTPVSAISSSPSASFDYRTQMSPSAVPDVAAVTEANFFTASQMAALRKLCDIFLPAANGYPSAAQTGTPEFLDFLIGTSPAARKKLYQNGLDRLNSEAYKQFSVHFSQVTAAQADQLLKPWLRTWINDHPPTEPYARFINLAHSDIRSITMNSQAWSLAATSSGERAPGIGLYWSPIDPDIQKHL